MTTLDRKLERNGYYKLQDEAPDHILVYIQGDVITVTDTSREDTSGLLTQSLDIYQSSLEDFDADEARAAIEEHATPGAHA